MRLDTSVDRPSPIARRAAGTSGARRRQQIAAAYLLMAPAVVLVLGVLAYPLGWEVWVSLTNLSPRIDGPSSFVGLANYRHLLGDPAFWRSLAATAFYFVVTTGAKLGLGVALALLLARPSRWRAVAFVAVFLPWAYPGGVSVIAWYWMLNPPLITSYSVAVGTIKHAIDSALGGGAYAFASVVLFNIWRGGSFTAVFLLAGLNAIPTELLEYARLESRSPWQRFWRVTVPLLRPYLALAAFLSFTTAFADLANVWMLTGGRIIFPLIGTHAYWLGIKSGEFGQAAAWSLSLVPLLIALLVVLFRWVDRADDEAPA